MSAHSDWLRQVKICREINQKINEFGVSDYQRLKLIELLALELENRDAMLSVLEVVKPHIINKEELIAPEGDKAGGQFSVDTME